MKKIMAIILTMMLLLNSLVYGAEVSEPEWICPNCGEMETGNFCSNCGNPKGEFEKDVKDSEVAYHFYTTIQNKFHYAITGHTAGSADYVHGEMWNRNIAVVDRHLDRGKCMHWL